MAEHSPMPHSPYCFVDLETETSFRILELLPGSADAPIKCLLHVADWHAPPEYEAVSYAWGDHQLKAPIKCNGKRIEIGRNLHSGLSHLRWEDRSRYLWVDCLCMHQDNVLERNQQVRQMRRIYEKAKVVVTWLGPDTPDGMASVAINSIKNISSFLCERLNLQIAKLSTKSNLYHEVLYNNRHELPIPSECDFSSETLWQSLIWFYSHPYFSRLWIIQEINASTSRTVQCGRERIEWDHVDLVAGYIIMDTHFSKSFGFSKTYCWWAATVTTERMRNPKNWLSLLYLASNFACLDTRDTIFGLWGLFKLPEGSRQAKLLEPDYLKSVVEVFGDSVEAAFFHFENTDVLLYLVGDESPSWIPRWNRPMLFRNPFRFGKALPWKPAGDIKLQCRFDKQQNVLRIVGFVVDTVQSSVPYNERYFDNASLEKGERKAELQNTWSKVLAALAGSQQPESLPISTESLTAAATALSYGLDADANPADPQVLLYNFVAYLSFILPSDLYAHYISAELSDSAKEKGKGLDFGKPVWDFAYPESGFFVTSTGLVGCSTCIPQQGDVVVAASGSTYPFILRPRSDEPGFLIRGYAYVHGVMRGEMVEACEMRTFDLH